MSKLIEEWRDIPNTNSWYQGSDWGRIKSIPHYVKNGNGKRLTKERILKTYLAGRDRDYHYVKLHCENEILTIEVHRTIAELFIPNPENKPEVDHISGDKNDNSVWNLRRVTSIENRNNPSTSIKYINNPKKSHQVYQYTLNGELVRIWPSKHEAERYGYGRKEIKKCCEGLQKQHKGYIWSYIPL